MTGASDDLGSGQPIEKPRGTEAQPHRGAVVLGLGISALVLLPLVPLGVILGAIAWVMGNKDLGAMNAGRMDPSGRGLTRADRLLGIVSCCLGAVATGVVVAGSALLVNFWLRYFGHLLNQLIP